PRDHAPTLQHSAPRCNSGVGAHRQYDVLFLVCFWRGREAPADGWAPLPGQPGPFWQMVGVARQEESASDEASADRHCAGTVDVDGAELFREDYFVRVQWTTVTTSAARPCGSFGPIAGAIASWSESLRRGSAVPVLLDRFALSTRARARL